MNIVYCPARSGFIYKTDNVFLFLSFRRVLDVICSFLDNSPASEF